MAAPQATTPATACTPARPMEALDQTRALAFADIWWHLQRRLVCLGASELPQDYMRRLLCFSPMMLRQPFALAGSTATAARQARTLIEERIGKLYAELGLA